MEAMGKLLKNKKERSTATLWMLGGLQAPCLLILKKKGVVLEEGSIGLPQLWQPPVPVPS